MMTSWTRRSLVSPLARSCGPWSPLDLWSPNLTPIFSVSFLPRRFLRVRGIPSPFFKSCNSKSFKIPSKKNSGSLLVSSSSNSPPIKMSEPIKLVHFNKAPSPSSRLTPHTWLILSIGGGILLTTYVVSHIDTVPIR